MKNVNILGQNYNIEICNEAENIKLDDSYGYVELYSKKIVLANIEDDKRNVENILEFKKKILRHEILHAFFHEAGLNNYCKDEQLVDFLAIQLYKIYNASISAENIVYNNKVGDKNGND